MADSVDPFEVTLKFDGEWITATVNGQEVGRLSGCRITATTQGFHLTIEQAPRLQQAMDQQLLGALLKGNGPLPDPGQYL